MVHALPSPVSVAVIVLLLRQDASGTVFFAHARPDPLVAADAIVVLGGEHDRQEAYDPRLGEQGSTPTVLMSDPYGSRDSVMKKSCKPRPDIEVICRRPVPSATRGEAMMRVIVNTCGSVCFRRPPFRLIRRTRRV